MSTEADQLEVRWKAARAKLAAIPDQSSPEAVSLLDEIDTMEEELEYLAGMEWFRKRPEDR